MNTEGLHESPPATPPSSTSPQMPTRRTFPFFAMFIIVMLCAVGFLVFQNWQLQKQVASMQFAPTPIPTAIPSPDPKTNWKTYTNTQYGFSIQYPQTWKDITSINTIENGNLNFTLQTDKNEFIQGVIFTGMADGSSDQSWSKRIALKNNKSLLLTYTDNLGPGSKGGTIDIEAFNQMLSTFKLLDQASTINTSTWKTHTSNILGVEFKLPSDFTLESTSGVETPGDTGSQYCMMFTKTRAFKLIPKAHAGVGPCGGGVINLGTVSTNYTAGRGGGFGDFTGYAKNGSLFYPRFINTPITTALPQEIVREVTNTHGVTYLKIKGENIQTEMGEMGRHGTPGGGNVGALFNKQNTKYAGFNMQMEVASSTDEAIFDQILSTFKFLPD